MRMTCENLELGEEQSPGYTCTDWRRNDIASAAKGHVQQTAYLLSELSILALVMVVFRDSLPNDEFVSGLSVLGGRRQQANAKHIRCTVSVLRPM